MRTFICGLDLGQVNDPTALIIAERIAPPDGASPEEKARYDIRHIERFLGQPYPTIVDRVVARFEEIQPDNDVRLVVDGTGVGRPVCDLFRPRLGGRMRPVTITGGDVVSEDEHGYLRVPKRDLAGSVQVLLQSNRMRFANRLQDAVMLKKELLNFKVKIDSKTAHDSYGEWRAGQHDDLVLALALAVWFGEHQMFNPADYLSFVEY